jgi:hypothetical protein
MNHFEKCLFWWYVVYQEAFEFQSRFPNIPSLTFTFKELFSYDSLEKIASFCGLPPLINIEKNIHRNAILNFWKELFPIKDEWKKYKNHKEIVSFAEKLGYQFSDNEFQMEAKKYSLPDSFISHLRYKTNYWYYWLKIIPPLKEQIKKAFNFD